VLCDATTLYLQLEISGDLVNLSRSKGNGFEVNWFLDYQGFMDNRLIAAVFLVLKS